MVARGGIILKIYILSWWFVVCLEDWMCTLRRQWTIQGSLPGGTDGGGGGLGTMTECVALEENNLMMLQSR